MKTLNKTFFSGLASILLFATPLIAQFSSTSPGGNLVQYNNANVGIKLSTAPTQAFDVNGNIALRGTHLVYFSTGVIDWGGGGQGDLIFRSLSTSGDIGTHNTVMTLKNNGFLGIANTSPSQRLQVDLGNILVRGTNNFATNGNEAALFLGDANNFIKCIFGSGVRIGTYGAADAIQLASGSGNVGIGIAANSASLALFKLSVGGAIRAHKVVVETGWADYVFSSNYTLRTLNEVEQFIKENKRLPDMPSEREIIADGADIGNILKLQMQKIEELTLYILQQQKEITLLKASVNK